MSDHGTADPRHDEMPLPDRANLQAAARIEPTAPARESDASPVPEVRLPRPVAMLVVDVATGTVAAANPAGRRRLDGRTGLDLSRWVADLATASGTTAAEVTTLRAWDGENDAAAPATTWAECTPVDFRSRRCLLVVLRADATGHIDAGLLGEPPTGASIGTGTSTGTAAVADSTRAAFTLDAAGRIDSWGRTAARLTGFAADVVIGGDTTVLHPGPARLRGEPRRALAEARRLGEHRAEGWRVCGDGELIWAEVVTCALRDGLDRLVGFATTMHDLTAGRRLDRGTSARRVPAPRPAGGTGLRRPLLAHRTSAGRTAPRVPAQRRPANS